MLADFMPPDTMDLHAAGLVGGQAFIETFLNFGFTREMAFAGFTPNNSSMLRVMALGEVKVLLIETASLCWVSAEQDCAPVFSDFDYIEKVLLTLSSDQLKFMAGKGVLIHHGSQNAGDILYVPQGWIMVEQAVHGHNFIHGVRNSMMLKSPAAVSNYECGLELFRTSNRIVTRMAILAAMKS